MAQYLGGWRKWHALLLLVRDLDNLMLEIDINKERLSVIMLDKPWWPFLCLWLHGRVQKPTAPRLALLREDELEHLDPLCWTRRRAMGDMRHEMAFKKMLQYLGACVGASRCQTYWFVVHIEVSDCSRGGHGNSRRCSATCARSCITGLFQKLEDHSLSDR